MPSRSTPLAGSTEPHSALEAAQRLLARAHLLVPGLYAWLATVASPTLARDGPALARLSAFAALISLVSGPYLAVNWPRLGRAVGIFLFLGLCTSTWLLLGPVLAVERLEPVQAALGGLGWAAFAFGWGSLRPLGVVPEDHPNVLGGTPLEARGELPRGALWILGGSILGSVVCLVTAWRVARPEHSLLAHAAAIACAIAILTAGAKIAVGRTPKRQLPPPDRRIHAARRWLFLLVMLLLSGLVWQVLR